MKLHDILLTSLETRPLETKSNEKIWKKELDKSKKNEYNKSRWNGSLAQLVEHLTLNQGVRGSNPWWSTRHFARSYRRLRAFYFLPKFCKIHRFYQNFYQIKEMPFRSAWRDGIFWCSVTGFIIFFVKKVFACHPDLTVQPKRARRLLQPALSKDYQGNAFKRALCDAQRNIGN